MADTMDKFLKKYYKQLHFNAMPDGVRARFLDWVKNGTLTDEMKLWVRDYMIQNPDGTYAFKELPNPTNTDHLSEADARRLFIAFQNAFAGMAADNAKFKDSNPQAYEFVEKYFGENKLFFISPANDKCEAGIKKIIELIKSNRQVKRIILTSKGDDGKPIFEKEDDLNDFISKCEKGDYNTNAALQKKVQTVAASMEKVTWSYMSSSPAGVAIENIHESLTDVLDKDAFAMDPNRIPTGKLNQFLGEIDEKAGKTGLLQILYYNKNIRDKFAEYDNGVITKPLNSAENSVNYQDNTKGNYVPKKSKDTKTPLQRLEDWAIDTYEDYFAKYDELRGGTLFYTQEAKEIFKAIDKNKIKPADGLKTLLDKAKDVEGKINNPEIRDHFKWFVETMTQIAKDKPKAVEGAWSNANQMKAVITEIILKATDPKNNDPHAMEKAVTAMEIMNAMKYGMMTSKIMDAMKQTEFSIFSDGKLSWNKNEGIQFVTRAFDKSIKAAFLAVGYAVTIVGNKINLSGMQITNDNNSELAKRFQEASDDLANASASEKRMLRSTIDKAKQTRGQQQSILDNLKSKNFDINKAREQKEDMDTRFLEPLKKDMEQAEKDKEKFQKQIDEQQATLDRLQPAKDEYDKMQRIINGDNLKDLEKQKDDENKALQGQIDELNKMLSEPIKGPDGKPIKDRKQKKLRDTAIQQQIVALTLEITKNKQEKQKAQNEQQGKVDEANKYLDDKNLKELNEEYKKAQKARDKAQDNLDDANDRFERARSEYEQIKCSVNYTKLSDKITQFDDATKRIKEMNDTINKEQNALDNWDKEHVNKVRELQEFWNQLQGGENTAWFGRTSTAQQLLDQQLLKQKLLQIQNS